MTHESLERSFQVPSPASLTLSNLRGSVDIQAGEDGVITIRAIKHLDSGDAEKTTIEMDQATDGSLKVKTQHLENSIWLLKNSPPCKVDYIVQMPSDCSLFISGVSSSTTIRAVSGPVSIKSVSGSLKLSQIDGDLKVNTVSGWLSGKWLSGTLQMDAVSGSAKILESNLASVNCSSVSGRVFLQTKLGTGPYRFRSISGNVKIALPKDSRYFVQSRSISGRVKSSRQNNCGTPGGGKGTVQDGSGVTIYHNSVSGNLSIDSGPPSSEDGDTSPNISTQKGSTTPKEILDRIAGGELSVEEALESLKPT